MDSFTFSVMIGIIVAICKAVASGEVLNEKVSSEIVVAFLENVDKSGNKLINKIIEKEKRFDLRDSLEQEGFFLDEESYEYLCEFLSEIINSDFFIKYKELDEAFENTVLDRFDQKLKCNPKFMYLFADNYVGIVKVFVTWARHIWFDANNKDSVIFECLYNKISELGSTNKNSTDPKNNEDRVVENRYIPYKNEWKKSLFLHRKKLGQTESSSVSLKDLYVDPEYRIGGSDGNCSDLEKLITNEVICTENIENKMLLVLGQPGIGKSSMISWFINNVEPKLKQIPKLQILVYRFTDFHNLDWKKEKILGEILNQIGYSDCNIENTILFLDGFDEISVDDRIGVLNRMYADLVDYVYRENFCIFITCRENYLSNDEINRKVGGLKCSYVTLQPLSERLIKKYYSKYVEKMSMKKDGTTLNVFYNNRDVFGIPIILYMTLALSITIKKETSVFDVYERIFNIKDGIYDTDILKTDVNRVSNTERKKQIIREISQEFAIWMYQENSDAAAINEAEYKRIVKEAVPDMAVEDILISSYFRYCEGIGSSEICFVHRTMYEYFTADKIATEIFQSFSAREDDMEFMKRMFRMIEKGDLASNSCNMIRAFIKFKLIGLADRNVEIMDSLYEWFEKCMDCILKNGFVRYSEWKNQNFVNLINQEIRCFSNCVILLSVISSLTNRKITIGRSEEKTSEDDYLLTYFRTAIEMNKRYFTRYLERFDLRNLCLSGLNLSEANLKNAELADVECLGANLYKAKLNGANITNAQLQRTNLKLANMAYAIMNGTKFTGSYMYRADLTKAVLTNADLQGVNLTKADLSGAILVDADLSRCDLTAANLNGADLRGAILAHCELKDVKMYRAKVYEDDYDPKFKAFLRRKGVEFVERSDDT